jgi:hypothetical protein
MVSLVNVAFTTGGPAAVVPGDELPGELPEELPVPFAEVGVVEEYFARCAALSAATAARGLCSG